MTDLTPYQRKAFDLRQRGHTLKEIARIMGTTREPVRQWIAAARRKLVIKSEIFEREAYHVKD
jgi:DNA-binding CsgD family transcriptional regulator